MGEYITQIYTGFIAVVDNTYDLYQKYILLNDFCVIPYDKNDAWKWEMRNRFLFPNIQSANVI